MNICPACSKAIHPNDLVCPHCGISLHHETATAGPASGGGSGLSVVVIIIVAVIGILLVLGCLGAAGFFFIGFPVAAPARAPRAVAPMPVDMAAQADEPMPATESETNPGETPAGQPTGDEPTPENDGEPL